MGTLIQLLGLVVVFGTVGGPAGAEQKIKDFDAPRFGAAKATLLDRGGEPSNRAAAMRELVRRDAAAARAVIAGVLGDESFEVRRQAAEWLSAMGDQRGLDWQAKCLRSRECAEVRHHAARLLGNAKDRSHVPVIRAEVTRIFESGIRGPMWRGGATDRAVLKYGAIALARIGVPEDRELVLDVVGARPNNDPDFLEALGYIDDPRALDLLWSAYRGLVRRPTCGDPGLGVPALLPLSRLRDENAIRILKDILLGVGTPDEPARKSGRPLLCADRAQAFRELRPRDGQNFAETVFEVIARQPEGPGTFEGWNALGVMHPQGFGQRILKLAVSRPRWQHVSHHMLNTVVLAVDPDLHDEFWAAYDDVATIPAQLGMRTQIREGLGYLLFSGTGYWTGD
jgi:hypothetical protein